MDELIERLHNATGPDRKLDALIWRLMPCDLPDCSPSTKAVLVARILDGGDDSECPAYTGSMDAAMTLAEGLRGLSLHTRSNPDMGGRNWIVSAGSNRAAARSWPLALCMVGMQDRDKYAAATQS
jgi:hypothetical protein